MIGLSMSRCIREMAEGVVNPQVVTKIIAGTSIRTHRQLEEVIRGYRQMSWRKHPDACEMLVRKMLAEGKIEQPKLTIGKAPDLSDGICWVESEDEIHWGEQIGPEITPEQRQQIRTALKDAGITMLDAVDNRRR